MNPTAPSPANSSTRQRLRQVVAAPRRWASSVALRWALASSLGLWAAFPPLAWWPLAWVAPCGWLYLIHKPKLDGPRPYRAIYFAGLIHWMLMTQWVRLPHWSAGVGWLFLAAYLAVYVPLFVGLSRVLVHGCGISLAAAAPTVWVALEFVRGHFLTGFSLALLAHSQVDRLPLIQMASLVGAYGVSFVVLLTASAFTLAWVAWQEGNRRQVGRSLSAAAATVGCALAFGYAALGGAPAASDQVAKVAVIQGSLDTQFDGDFGRLVDAFDDYRTASLKAVAEHPDIDLLIWPESMFALGRSIIQYDAGVTRPAYWTEPYTVPETARICADEAARTVRQFGTRCLLGTQGLYCRESDVQRFNSAGFYGPDGELLAVYHKMHPVMFGEYVPLGEVLPWLYRLTPMPEGLSAGRQPMSFAAGGLRFSPSICFENTVPHLIRRQLAQLRADGQRVDVLVTLTNDGWFWGSSLLDLHLTCGVFRAVENRKPMLISANTGISAWIDSRGRVLEQGPRRASRTLVVDVAGDPSVSPYTRYGDWFAGLCLLATLAGLAQRFVKKIL